MRLIIDLILFLLLVIGSAPLTLILGIIGTLRYGRFWEFIVFGFLFELVYGVGGWSMPFPFPMFLGATVLFVLTIILREKLR